MTITGIMAEPSAGTASGRAAVLRTARRHTRTVRLLRVMLPLTAFLVTGVLWAVIVFDPRAQLAAQIDAESLGVSGSRIVMERPRLTGHNQDGKAYEVTAIRAEQNMQKPNEIDLFDLSARIEIRKNGWAELEAVSGHMDTEAQFLELFKRVSIRTDIGERAELSDTRADFAKGEIVTQKPVDIQFTRGTLTADSMHLVNNGQRASFQGRVRMTLQPDTAAPVAPPPSEAIR